MILAWASPFKIPSKIKRNKKHWNMSKKAWKIDNKYNTFYVLIEMNVMFWKQPDCAVYTISMFNPYSAGIDFSRQSLTSLDVRFWRLKSIAAL